MIVYSHTLKRASWLQKVTIYTRAADKYLKSKRNFKRRRFRDTLIKKTYEIQLSVWNILSQLLNTTKGKVDICISSKTWTSGTYQQSKHFF